MPDSLPPEIRRRLSLVLALLASDQDGECLNAARMAVKMLSAHGWRPEHLAERLTAGPQTERQQQRGQQQHRPPPSPNSDERIMDAAGFAAWVVEEAHGLTEWERGFLQDLIDKEWGRATEKQSARLHIIARKVPPTARKYGT